MNIAVMQPYLFPYLGYFQLIALSDVFVIYDDVQWKKGGWINRNIILNNGRKEYITVPIKRDSYQKNINERKISDSFVERKSSLLEKIAYSYKAAPYFPMTYKLISNCINYDSNNISKYVSNSIVQICGYLGINTDIMLSSDIGLDNKLPPVPRLLSIIKSFDATHYINPIGGQCLYDPKAFINHGISISFIDMKRIEYSQINSINFIPSLSIIDVMMNNSKDRIKDYIGEYDLITYTAPQSEI